MKEDVNVSKQGVHESVFHSADRKSDKKFSTTPQPDSADAAVPQRRSNAAFLERCTCSPKAIWKMLGCANTPRSATAIMADVRLIAAGL